MWKKAAFAVMCLVCLSGCRVQNLAVGEGQELEYELVEETEIPREMTEPISGRREKPFLLTYADGGDLYIARGYGRQETKGYEIQVDQLCESENAIVLKTTLLGPETEEEAAGGPSCPYIVVRIEYSDKYVLTE